MRGSQGLLLTGTSRNKKAGLQVAGRLNRRGSGQISGEEKHARVSGRYVTGVLSVGGRTLRTRKRSVMERSVEEQSRQRNAES